MIAARRIWASQGWRRTLRLLAALVALVGFVNFGLSLREAILVDGGRAYDAFSYWIAGLHLREGLALYEEVGIGDPGAYRYTPTFAALMAPIALMPELAFTWLYRIACLLCLRYLVGSWTWVGWSLLFPPVGIELMALNVTLPIAAVARWSLRGPRPDLGAAVVPFTATLKYASVLLVPYLIVHRPETRRALVGGTLLLVVVSLVHAAIAPDVWVAFLRSIAQQSQSVNAAPYVGDQLLFLVPSTLWDFVIRFGLAALMMGIAISRRWTWLAFTAVTIAVPTLWLARLAPLVAVPRLALEDWRERRPAMGRMARDPVQHYVPGDLLPG